jgi:hypothetical protein
VEEQVFIDEIVKEGYNKHKEKVLPVNGQPHRDESE